MMKKKQYFRWNDEKNKLLKNSRGVCFEQVVLAVEKSDVLVVADHPNRNKYPNQEMMVVNIGDYVYLVPFVRENDITFFLKTIIPDRKATKKYLGGQK
ncbi:MAG: toxin [Candidatus Omnitrophota bacterium]